MPNSFSNAYTLMMWPWTQARTSGDWLEMISDAQQVIAARMPTLWQAFLSPMQADYREIGLMWSEKSAAFTQSAHVLDRARRHLEIASDQQRKIVDKAQTGTPVTFFDLLETTEKTLTAMATLALLPAEALQPVKSAVAANSKRLATRRTIGL
ncbi:hypothetical protein OOT33_11310 [Sphingobium sp. DEHP117]|uniref:hypothetical protein n=1 Tax=Sphingobium sp. DEHP117 TaxID=2993436 RepID=UPI0027D66B30|nr:hypothetical protein [Sphingobium sp. DEHP117]MDQ4421015.1 hypothetical protein [Sphingobium sp. DEHP117]